MKKRKLGKFGPEVSAIGIGAMSFSDFYGPTDEAQSHQILTAALDGGITHLDTANVYGNGCSENAIGTFLAKQGRRKDDFFQSQPRLVFPRMHGQANECLTIAKPICNPS